jgi:hypothetical protein
MKRYLLWTLAVAAGATGISGCNSASVLQPSTAFTPLPVLVAGSKYTYSGSDAETITYASPSPVEVNSHGTYSVSDAETVEAASPGAPAPFEVRRSLRYSVIKAPVSGIELAGRTIDSFESSTVTNTSQTIAQAASSTRTTGIDLDANRIEKNGPYAYTEADDTTFAVPRVLAVYPLRAGEKTTEPLARTVANKGQSVNRDKDVYASHDTKSVFKDDGAYVETGSVGPNETTNVTEKSNGTAKTANTGGTSFTQIIGIPEQSNGVYLIPVTRDVNGTTTSYKAADWYPGSALPPSPLAMTVQTVKGPSALPTSCKVGVSAPNVEEIDSVSVTLNVTGFRTDESGETFLSNGVTVCRANRTTTRAYDVVSGALISTIDDTFIEGLSSESPARRQARL